MIWGPNVIFFFVSNSILTMQRHKPNIEIWNYWWGPRATSKVYKLTPMLVSQRQWRRSRGGSGDTCLPNFLSVGATPPQLSTCTLNFLYSSLRSNNPKLVWVGSPYRILNCSRFILTSTSLLSVQYLTAYPAPCWASGFSTTCCGGGGGGRLNASPMISAPGRRREKRKQRSKAREKAFRNHFGQFLAQIKIEVTRGQNSKIF